MGKISQVSSKYIIHAGIDIEGVVDRPDVIGAIFGQTEGLLGAELELRELQRSGRIGRIEVNTETKGGKTRGSIIVPSSLDKAETSLIAAALEVIQRIGPCNAKIKIKTIEDVRITKRNFVLQRAKELLKTMVEGVMPDSQELADEVAYSVRMMGVQEYGKDRLPAGPGIEENDDVIVVEGRADVLILLKHGFKNVIAMNGTSCPQTIIDLSRKKEITAFVDGDRGGDLIIKELLNVAELDFVTRAPDGKEVEELTKKEIHKALRSKMTAEQVKMELGAGGSRDTSMSIRKHHYHQRRPQQSHQKTYQRRPQGQHSSHHSKPAAFKKEALRADEKAKFRNILENLIGTRGAYILDNKIEVLGKVPLSELPTTVKSLSSGIYAIAFDGVIEKSIVEVAERARVKHIVAMDSKVNPRETRVNLIVASDL